MSPAAPPGTAAHQVRPCVRFLSLPCCIRDYAGWGVLHFGRRLAMGLGRHGTRTAEMIRLRQRGTATRFEYLNESDVTQQECWHSPGDFPYRPMAHRPRQEVRLEAA